MPWDKDLDLGTGFFVGRKERTEEERNRHPGKVLPVSQVIRLVEEFADASWSEICRSRQGRGGNPLRRFAIWALRRCAGQTPCSHRDIAKLLDTTPGAVNQALLRLRSRKEAAKVREWEEKFRCREKV